MKSKRLILLAVFLALQTILFSTPAFGVSELNYQRTGDQRSDIVNVALTQVGSTNEDHRYRNDDASWCASFVCWCAREAGIDYSIIQETGWASADDLGVTYRGRSADRSTGIDYIPTPGDIIIFDWKSDGYCLKEPASFYGDHVGIVVDVDGEVVHTVEGNSSGMVRRQMYFLTDSDIKGYGVPDYLETNNGLQFATVREVNFRMYAGDYCNAYENAFISKKAGRVYPGDLVTVIRVMDNGTVLLSCPWETGTNRDVYCATSELKFKATKYIEAFGDKSFDSNVGRVYPNDVCQIVEIDPDAGSILCVCPWEGGEMKSIYIRYSDID